MADQLKREVVRSYREELFAKKNELRRFPLLYVREIVYAVLPCFLVSFLTGYFTGLDMYSIFGACFTFVALERYYDWYRPLRQAYQEYIQSYEMQLIVSEAHLQLRTTARQGKSVTLV